MTNNKIANACFWASLVSVAASIGVWSLTGETDPAHAERFGIFVGLWAPTLMGLANWFKKQSQPSRGDRMDMLDIWNELSWTDGVLFSVWLGVMYYGKAWIDHRFKEKE